jgi:hypothetical protein
MRTTVDVPDETYRAIKVMAAEEGVTVRELVLEGLERVMRAKQVNGQTAGRATGGSPGLEVSASAESGLAETEREIDDDVIGFP